MLYYLTESLIDMEVVNMRLLNANINCFGGTDNHREEYKKLYGNRKYLNIWDQIGKSQNVAGLLEDILKISPDIVILQEYDINSKEAKDFNKKMNEHGYIMHSETIEYRRASMTVFYVKKGLEVSYVSTGHTKNGRAYAVKIDETIIYGTHVPPVYDSQYWNELKRFVRSYCNQKIIAIGNYNIINYKNKNEYSELLESAVDIWKAQGNKEGISVMGDSVIASKTMNKNSLKVSRHNNTYTDHPIIIVDVN